ncbi:MAG TPA: hypothetical protein VKE69_14835, partial [Planctomycetota bacterium]|nr:hypothetical protein [Planctomycetota bacterium]
MKTTAIFFATGLALGLLVGGLLFSSADTDGDPAGSSPTLETPELRPRAGSRAATATRTAEAVAYVATSAPRSRGAERAHAEPADPDDADAGIAGIVVDGAGRPVSHIVVEAKL